MRARALLRFLLAVCVVVNASSLAACAAPEDDDAESSEQGVTLESRNERIVRSYYAAARSADPAAALTPIVGDDAILSAPSVKILKGVPEVRGKAEFIKAVDGGAFLIGKADVRELMSRGNLVVARIELPLPNGDRLTQVEYFVIEGGKIARMDSYYDALRFIAALPAIALDRLKAAFSR